MTNLFVYGLVAIVWLFVLVSMYNGWRAARKYKGPGKGVTWSSKR